VSVWEEIAAVLQGLFSLCKHYKLDEIRSFMRSSHASGLYSQSTLVFPDVDDALVLFGNMMEMVMGRIEESQSPNQFDILRQVIFTI
jgi:hypothetical protein